MDYVFRYIGMKYLSPNDREELFGPVDQYLAEDHGAEPIPVAQENETSKNDKILAELVHSATDVAFIFDKQGQKGQVASAQRESNIGTGTIGNGKAESLNADAPLCNGCGTIMIRAGSCYSCPNCFATTGVCN